MSLWYGQKYRSIIIKSVVREVKQRLEDGSIFVCIALKIPPSERLAFLPVPHELFILSLTLRHFKQITFTQIFRFDQFIWLTTLASQWVISKIFGWRAIEISISHASIMLWCQHLSDLVPKFLMGQCWFVSHLSNSAVVKDRPQALFCWEIT